MFVCLECGKKYKTVKAAEKASYNGCSKCGGVDIDLDTHAPKENPKPTPKPVPAQPAKPDTDSVVLVAPGGLKATIEVTKTGAFLFNGVEIDVYSNEK